MDPPVSPTVQDYLSPGTVLGELAEIETAQEESTNRSQTPVETDEEGAKTPSKEDLVAAGEETLPTYPGKWKKACRKGWQVKAGARACYENW